MSKNKKILLLLFSISLLLILYLIFTSETFWPAAKPALPTKQDNSAALENDYQSKVKEYFAVYGELIKNNSFNAANVNDLKNQLLGLRVPAKFKDLHIKFVMALTKLENYLSQKDEKEKTGSLETANQLMVDYDWLKN